MYFYDNYVDMFSHTTMFSVKEFKSQIQKTCNVSLSDEKKRIFLRTSDHLCSFMTYEI